METRLDQAAALNPNPGHRPFQRLNRAEYTRAVNAVLALDVDVSAFLPPDQISAGFDNVADSQGFSPTLMEGYLRAANRISSLAVGDPKAAPSATTYKVPRTGSQMRQVEGAPFGTRGGISVMHTFPADGEYSFRMQLHSIPTGQLFGSTVRGRAARGVARWRARGRARDQPAHERGGSERHEHHHAEDSRQGRHRSACRRRSWRASTRCPTT